MGKLLYSVISMFCLTLIASLTNAAESSDSDSVASKLGVDTWVLDFKPLEVRAMSVERSSGEGSLVWWLIYTVTNGGKEPVPFRPHVTAESDGGIHYCNIYLPTVEAAVEQEYGEKFFGATDREELFPAAERLKALKEIRAAGGEERRKLFEEFEARKRVVIKPGETKRCVATFGPLHPEADNITIRIRNLTGRLPVKTRDGKEILQELVFVVECEIPGDRFGQSLDTFSITDKKWTKVETEIPPQMSK